MPPRGLGSAKSISKNISEFNTDECENQTNGTHVSHKYMFQNNIWRTKIRNAPDNGVFGTGYWLPTVSNKTINYLVR
jgi:hypothetical protein